MTEIIPLRETREDIEAILQREVSDEEFARLQRECDTGRLGDALCEVFTELVSDETLWNNK